MFRLRNTKVIRKPGTGGASTWKRADTWQELKEVGTRYGGSDKRELHLSFSISASGGSVDTPGSSDVRVLMGTEDYAIILKAMCDVDREAALAAMSSELAKQLKKDA